MDLAGALTVAAVTLGISITVGLVCIVVLLPLRRSRLFLQVIVALLAGVVSVVLSMIAVANMMYLSAHDYIVAIYVAVLSGVSSALVAGALAVWISRNSRDLSRAATRIGQGEVVTASGRPGNAELSSIEQALAETSAQLRESREREARIEASRRELVAWISHDLRTPLSGIRAMAEALEDGMAEDPHRYYRQMRSQVDLLAGMVDDLFELSKLDAGSLNLVLEEVSLLDVVSDTVADLRPATRGRTITVDNALTADVVVRVDPTELSRAIGNLVMNAVQHTSAGPITVRTEIVDGRPTVSVSDFGGGIPDEDLERIFEPGWRGSTARTPRAADEPAPGAGLGLAIVKGIIAAHSGDVAVRNDGEGCRFDIHLPAVAATSGAN